MESTVQFDQDRTSAWYIHDFRMDGTILKTNSLEDTLGICKNLFEFRLFSNYHELLAEAHKCSSIAGPLVILEHSSSLDFSASNDRIDNVFSSLEIFLQENTSTLIVLVLVLAVTLVLSS
jgi:hypothetical protein